MLMTPEAVPVADNDEEAGGYWVLGYWDAMPRASTPFLFVAASTEVIIRCHCHSLTRSAEAVEFPLMCKQADCQRYFPLQSAATAPSRLAFHFLAFQASKAKAAAVEAGAAAAVYLSSHLSPLCPNEATRSSCDL